MEKHTRFEQVSQGRYEKPLVRVARNPGDPTDKEVEEHNVTHLPHCSWCPVCVKARGKEEAHKKVREQGEVPTVSMDYKSFGEASTEEDNVTMIVVKDETTGCVAALVCEQNSAADKWVVDRVCDDIELFGHSGMCSKEMESQHCLMCSPQSKRKERTQQFVRTRQRTILNPMGVRRESSTRSYVSGRGNENSSGPALGHHHEDRLEGTLA